MAKLISNKNFKRFIGIALSILLVVTLAPQVQVAYGNSGDEAGLGQLDDTKDVTAGDFDTELSDMPDGSEGAENGDEGGSSSPDGVFDKQPSDVSGNADGIVSDGDQNTPADNDSQAGTNNQEESGVSSQNDEGDGQSDEGDEQATDTDPERIDIPEDLSNFVIGPKEYTEGKLEYTEPRPNNEAYVLTVNGTHKGTIYVTGGATLEIKGAGTIDGKGAATVIHVDGKWSKLIFGKDSKDKETGAGVTVTGGDGGTALHDSMNFPSYTVGGGILVQRTDLTTDNGMNDGKGATLEFYNGTVRGNKAEAGGGIYIDRTCNFVMHNGLIADNHAVAIGKSCGEGGGIFIAGGTLYEGKDTKTGQQIWTSAANLTSQKLAVAPISTPEIMKGEISNNSTATTFDWGGGGIFVESKGVLKLGNALITENTAQGLGGGISGCPHAHIGIGWIEEGFALYGNKALGATQPTNALLHVLNTGTKNDPIFSGDLYTYGLTRTNAENALKTLYPSDPNLRSGMLNLLGFTSTGITEVPFSKTTFDVSRAQDYYCTKVSYIHGYALAGQRADAAWDACVADAQGSEMLSIGKHESKTFIDKTVGLTNTKAAGTAEITGRDVIIKNNTSGTHGGGIGCNGSIIVGKLGESVEYNPLSFDFSKKYVNSEGAEFTPLEDGMFAFELLRDDKVVTLADGESTEATNDANGKVRFSFNLAEDDFASIPEERTNDFTFELREVKGRNDKISYDADENGDPRKHTVVISVGKTVQRTNLIGESTYLDSYTPVVHSITIDGTEYKPADVDAATSHLSTDFTVTNTLQMEGSWTPGATKYYYGNIDNPSFTFSLKAVDEITDTDNVNIAALLAGGGPVTPGKTGKFNGDKAEITFEKQKYMKSGTYWYLMTEDGINGDKPGDSTVYAFKVKVEPSSDNTSLKSSVEKVYYAATDQAKALTEMTGESPSAEFYNSDMNLSLYGYTVNAMSNEPVDQKCLVDPKVYKVLEGRSLKADEFHFQLIQVENYKDTTGEVISATGNDQYGMVDFDAANNQAEEGEDPCCLLFTGPGDYYYRVVEDAKYDRDPSVDYSNEVITFTAKIRWCDADGNVVGDGLEKVDGAVQLVCTDMYYGQLIGDDNIRFEESADPHWHPTITNKARPMDLQVRKTSVTNRDEGLEGATYALYMVNDNEQGDIYLAESTSDGEGWIYYKDVPLSSGNLYYFKETGAPAGHTVSEFRSPYFYLVADSNSASGYVMKYADTKDVPSEQQMARKAAGANGSLATAPDTNADGRLVYTYENDGGVYDEATNVEFNKLDTRTHEWVEGAKLSIVEKDTGAVVSSWTSGKASEKFQKVLNVGTTYVLREDEAPEGYQKAADVEFVIDQYGKVAIVSGAENGNAALSDSTITLYDTALDAEEVVTQERETTREVTEKGKRITQRLAQTGDMLPLTALGFLVLISLIVTVFALRRRVQANAGAHRRK